MDTRKVNITSAVWHDADAGGKGETLEAGKAYTLPAGFAASLVATNRAVYVGEVEPVAVVPDVEVVEPKSRQKGRR